MKIVLMGAPGAGKGTQAVRICEKFNIPHISTGDILRQNIREATPLGLKVKEIIANGGLVTDDIMNGMIESRLAEADCVNGWLLDGFPRTIPQAEALDKICSPDAALNIDVPFERLLPRISGRRVCSCGQSYHVSTLGGKTACPACGKELMQREDDKEESVKVRLDNYSKQTAPLVGYYEKAGKLESVNGDDSVDNVFGRVVSAIKKYDNR